MSYNFDQLFETGNYFPFCVESDYLKSKIKNK